MADARSLPSNISQVTIKERNMEKKNQDPKVTRSGLQSDKKLKELI